MPEVPISMPRKMLMVLRGLGIRLEAKVLQKTNSTAKKPASTTREPVVIEPFMQKRLKCRKISPSAPLTDPLQFGYSAKNDETAF